MTDQTATVDERLRVLTSDVYTPLLCALLDDGAVQVFERRGRLRTEPLSSRPVRGAWRGVLAVAFLAGHPDDLDELRARDRDGDDGALVSLARELRSEVVSTAEVDQVGVRVGAIRAWRLYGRQDQHRDAYLLLIDPERSTLEADVDGVRAAHMAKVAERHSQAAASRARSEEVGRVRARLDRWRAARGFTAAMSHADGVWVDASVMSALLDAARGTVGEGCQVVSGQVPEQSCPTRLQDLACERLERDCCTDR